MPEHKRILKSECPHIIVGTAGRILQLIREKDLVTKHVKHFILDECDKTLQPQPLHQHQHRHQPQPQPQP